MCKTIRDEERRMPDIRAPADSCFCFYSIVIFARSVRRRLGAGLASPVDRADDGRAAAGIVGSDPAAGIQAGA